MEVPSRPPLIDTWFSAHKAASICFGFFRIRNKTSRHQRDATAGGASVGEAGADPERLIHENALPQQPGHEPGRNARTDAPPEQAASPDSHPIDHRPRDPVIEQLVQRMWRLPPGHPSSPYDGNGNLRPPPPDPWAGELPLPGEDGYDEPEQGESKLSRTAEADESGSIDSEETERTEQPEGVRESHPEASSTWREAVPTLRELWHSHTQRWPEAERRPADRSQDEPGSWRGDSGHYLNAEENLVSDHTKQRVSEVEKKTTQLVGDIKGEVPGAELAGLRFSLKGDERFKEKVAEELRAKPERSISEIAERMPDAIRYTYQFDTTNYRNGYWHACRLLQQRGNELLLSRNSWDDPEYKGINTRWLSQDGQVFEVQFHTAESFEAKQLTHKAYERLRSKSTGPEERPALEEFQSRVSSFIPIPDGATSIPDYRREGY
jgi:hypothetical protein